MKILFWNIRGVRKQIAREKFLELYRNFKYHILLLAELMVRPRGDTVLKLGLTDFGDDIIHNGNEVHRANLWVVSRRGLQIDTISSSTQHITVVVNGDVVSVVHAKSVFALRRPLWQQLIAVAGS